MNRRDFFSGAIGTVQESIASLKDDSSQDPQSVSKATLNARQTPNLVRSTKGLEAIRPADWGTKLSAHLLRRTMFGPTRAEIQQAASQTLDATLTALFAAQTPPDPPIGPSPPLTSGQTWVNSALDSLNEGQYSLYLKAWWVGLMAREGISLQEKMVLFWHNHFVTEYNTVNDSRFMYKQLSLFRQNAFGNFKALVKSVTLDPAMLRYLNGDTNTKAHANENYGRELQELFTIGKGPQVAQGDYTNYTEQDVQAAAKVLTGYSDVGYRSTTSATIDYTFTAANHDTTAKQFSADYGNRVIQRTLAAEYTKELDDMLDMIFSQVDTDGVNKVARYMCRKFYRWFVYYSIDATTEQNVIIPLANIMSSNNFEVKPVLQALFSSANFYDDVNIGCVIKNPIDFLVGTVRQTGIPLPVMTDPTAYYPAFNDLRSRASTLEMNVLDPPNVAGWAAYYQIPDFYELWIGTTTLPTRGSFTDLIFTGVGSGNGKLVFDPIVFATTMGTPADPSLLINDLATQLFPIPLTQTQKDYLIYSAMGLTVNGEGSWTDAWTKYWATGGQTPTNKTAVLKMLTPLLKFMFRMAEYQLA